jgi:class 3 adenylate cyclase
MVVEASDVAFTQSPDGTRIAYQVIGSGPRDLVLVDAWVSALDLMWGEPRIARFLEKLATVGRVILFDKRGNGASDALDLSVRWRSMMEDTADDLLAVLDAVGADAVDVIGSLYGGWPSLLFASTHPERCRKLVLQDACARLTAAEDYPCGMSDQALQYCVDTVREHWGRGVTVFGHAIETWGDLDARAWHARYERLAAERTFTLGCWEQMRDVDVRAVLPLVQAETLVIGHDDNPVIGSGSARYLADHIPTARLVELSGMENLYWADDRHLDLILEFLGAEVDPGLEADRVLATVLFTDLVDSTAQLVRVGDERWRALLDAHDQVTAETVDMFRGRLVKRTGDGILATFDGAARAVRCALKLRDALRRHGLPIRAGVHAGEVELRGDDVGGLAVHVAARVMATAGDGEVVASRTVRDLTAGSGLTFSPKGLYELKGLPERIELFGAAT